MLPQSKEIGTVFEVRFTGNFTMAVDMNGGLSLCVALQQAGKLSRVYPTSHTESLSIGSNAITTLKWMNYSQYICIS